MKDHSLASANAESFGGTSHELIRPGNVNLPDPVLDCHEPVLRAVHSHPVIESFWPSGLWPARVGLKGATLQAKFGATAAWAGVTIAKGIAARASEAAESRAVFLTGVVALNILITRAVMFRPESAGPICAKRYPRCGVLGANSGAGRARIDFDSVCPYSVHAWAQHFRANTATAEPVVGRTLPVPWGGHLGTAE